MSKYLDSSGVLYLWEKVKGALSGKQDRLTAGEGVEIEGEAIRVTTPVKGVTQAEYDALSEEAKNAGLYVVTDANISLKERGEVYSTEETMIGTWIDGKPLYRKVVKGETPSKVSAWNSIANIENVDVWAGMRGTLYYSVEKKWIAVPDSTRMLSGDSEGNISIYNTNNATVNSLIICTVEYTKTTDEGVNT